MGKTAIVAGATGLIGRVLVEHLLHDSDYETVITLVRRTTQINNEKLTEIITDWTEESIHTALQTCLNDADVFCSLGTTMKKAQTKEQFRKVDYEYPMLLAKAAKQGKAARFLLVSSMGANSSSKFFYNQVKGEVEDGLRGLGLRSLLIFRPSLLLGHRDEFRPGERIGQFLGRSLSFLLIGRLRKYKPISVTLVAQGMIRAAKSGAVELKIYPSDEIAP
jgi:uncharacterized protein YbjT (DUF2867 family)